MKNCKTPEYPDIIALIPEGLPQLIDFEVAANAFDRSTYAYHEEPLNNPVDEPQARLHVLEANEDQELISVVSGQMLDPTYTLRPSKDLAPWMGKWLPIPFLREEHTLQEGG